MQTVTAQGAKGAGKKAEPYRLNQQLCSVHNIFACASFATVASAVIAG